MKFWKKFGWCALGLTPLCAVLLWQVVASVVGMIVYSVYMGIQMATQGTDTSNVDYETMMSGFLTGTPYAMLMFGVYIGYIAIFGLWYWLMFCRKKQTGDWKQVLKPQRIGGIIGAGIAVQLGISMVLTIVLDRLPKLAESYSAVMNTLGSESVFMVMCVCILAPIGEELIFRGVTFRIFKKAAPWQVALVLQGILFGVYHLNLVQGVYAMIMGFILGYLAQRYGSVVPGILLHMAINASSYFVGYLLPESIETNTPMQIIVAVIAIAATAGFIYLTVKGTKATETDTAGMPKTSVQNIPAN